MNDVKALETNFPAPFTEIRPGIIESIAEFDEHVQRHEQSEDLLIVILPAPSGTRRSLFVTAVNPTALAAFPYSEMSFIGRNLLSTLGGSSVGDAAFPQGRNSEQWGVVDDFSITKSNHTFKMGVNYRRNDLSDHDAAAGLGGHVFFTSLNDFATGTLMGTPPCPTCPGGGDQLLQPFTVNGNVPIAYWSLGAYFQDEWRATPNLKLTLALRGDRNSNPVCQKNCFADLITPFTSLSHDYLTTGYGSIINAGRHSAFRGVEKIAMQPRFGLAWTARAVPIVIFQANGIRTTRNPNKSPATCPRCPMPLLIS